MTPAHYPIDREVDLVLRGGSTIHVRPIRPDDESVLLDFLRSMSLESRMLRFFSAAVDFESAARQQAHVDYVNDFGLVATIGVRERIVGHAMYARVGVDRAEVAVAVADDVQGQGLGTLLIGQLAEIAAVHDIHVFEADVLPANYRMINVFRSTGFPIEIHSRIGDVRVTFPTSVGEEALARFERREQVAATNAINTILRPRSVAVIGASNERGTVGGELFHNLLEYEFAGPVYPVNSHTHVVQSVFAYPSVAMIPGPVDLAIIAVPSAEVIAVAEQCARKGVRALVVVSAGFAERDDEARSRQAELVQVCRAAGMRLVGPNSSGVVNTDPEVRLNASFGPTVPLAGRVGLASQSGAIGLAIADRARGLGIGLSSVVSTGNKADISGNDLLMYWENDPRTDIILLYLESFGNPRKFSRLARQVGRSKPIIVVKSDRSPAVAQATSTRPEAMVAESDLTVDSLFRQAGVIRTNTLDELFDVTALLTRQPPPKGRRIGIVTNTGGAAILCADTADAEGLVVPVLNGETQERLRSFLPEGASVANPVDMLTAAGADEYRQAISVVAGDPNVDAVVAIFVQPLARHGEDLPAAFTAATEEVAGQKPVVAVFMASGINADSSLIPFVRSPESAVIALARAARYGEWRAREWTPPIRPDGIERDAAAALVASVLESGGGWLEPAVVAQLFNAYGLPLVQQNNSTMPGESVLATDARDRVISIEVTAPSLIDTSTERATRRASGSARHEGSEHEVEGRPTDQEGRLSGSGARPLRSDDVELAIGLVHDRHFGPIVVCGVGGVMADVLKDTAVRLTPLTTQDATAMVRELKIFPVLSGLRDGMNRDTDALVEVLVRLSTLAEDLPNVIDVECGPVLVHVDGVTIAGARVRVEHVDPPLPLGARTR